MSWLRRLLLLAGLVTGAWLLGGAGEANADVKIEIDQLEVEVRLPVADIGLKVETGLAPREAPVPPRPAPRIDSPAPPPPVAPQTPAKPVEAPAPVRAEAPQQQTQPPSATRSTDPAPVPQRQPQPQAEQPITGTLPQSGGAGQTSGNQVPAGTLPQAMRPPTTTTSLISTEQQDVPRIVRAEEPTFSPD